MQTEQIADKLIDGLNAIITHPRIEREVAFGVDVVICLALTIIPSIGVKLAFGYALLRDVIPFLGFGKRLYGLEVMTTHNGARAHWRSILARNLLLLIPGLNIVDIIYFLVTERRVTDMWMNLDVTRTGDVFAETEDEEEQQIVMPSDDDDEPAPETPKDESDEEPPAPILQFGTR